MQWTVFCVLVIAVATNGVELPNSFKLCKRSNPQYSDCLNNAVRDAMVSLAPGLRSFKILPIEPLAVDSIAIGDTQGAVSLRQEYKNIKLHGLTNGLEISNYNIDWKNLILESDAYNPQVDFVADYKINGKILLLPVHGNGKSNITMFGLKTHAKVLGETYQKNGETYFRVKKYGVKFNPAKVTLRFDNLFDGDTVLGEQMSRFLNENSDLLFKELQTPYEETFSIVFKKISNEIFSRVPMDKIFLK